MSNYRKHGDINTHKQSLSVYYTFPRASINFQDNPIELTFISNDASVPFYSSSMFNYLSELKKKAQVLNEKWIYYNAYMWLYLPTTVKNTCVSNIPHIYDANVFVHSNIILYEMIEMFSVLHLHAFNEHPPLIHACHFGNNKDVFEASVRFVVNDHGKEVIHCAKKKADFISIDSTLCEQDNEYEISKMTLKYICQALSIQRKRGVLILKIGDCFTKLSLDIIYVLSSFYEKTYFMKPTVSFLASGTRYVVCKDFRIDRLSENMHRYFFDLQKQVTTESRFIHRILKDQIPVMFSNRLEEINSILGQPRLEYIHQCLTQYEQCNDKTNHTIPNDVRKCVDWCVRFKVPIRTVYNAGYIPR